VSDDSLSIERNGVKTTVPPGTQVAFQLPFQLEHWGSDGRVAMSGSVAVIAYWDGEKLIFRGEDDRYVVGAAS
jgi:hypothetical protein